MDRDFSLFRCRLLEAGYDMESIEKILSVAQKSMQPKKYGLVWEEQPEEHVDEIKDKIIYFEENKAKSILKGEQGQSHHVLIEGDNYDALRLLQLTHKEKIDLIFIDPPYNTKNKDFAYNDFFVGENDSWKHSKWLSFMKKRLVLAKELLKEDGVMFISIDDHEMAQLKLLCDELFGEQNFIQNFMWLHGKGKKNKQSRTLQQYVLCYSKNKALLNEWKENVWTDYDFKNPDNDPKGVWFSGSISFTESRSNPNHENYYSIQSPSGVTWTRQWQVSKSEMDHLISNGDIYFGEYPNYDNVPREKIRPSLIEVIPSNIIENKGTTKGAETELKNILGVKNFDYPKPIALIKHLINISGVDSNAIILDFFAGSGTTGHAVLELNSEDNGCRQFILCTNNEVSEKTQKSFLGLSKKDSLDEYIEANKSAYLSKIQTEEFQSLGICHSVTYPRIYKVITGYRTPNNKKIPALPAFLHYLTINKDLKKEALLKTPNLLPEDKTLAILPYAQTLVQLKENIWNECESLSGESFRVFGEGDTLFFLSIKQLTTKELLEVKNIYCNSTYTHGVLYTFSIDANESAIYSLLSDVGIQTKPIPRQFIDGMEEWN